MTARHQLQEDYFEFPIVTVDGVIFQIVNNELAVLLIRRGFEPFLGTLALPGAYIPKDMTSLNTLNKTLIEKTGVSLDQFDLIEQPSTFDVPGRDPRGYAITVMYIGLGKNITPGTHPGMINGQEPAFFPVQKLPTLAYDHATIIAYAHNRLKSLITHTNSAVSLMPQTFTLSELQTVYEAILCRVLDKRNFRKKILTLNILKDTNKVSAEGAHRPARLYSFRKSKPDISSYAEF